MLVLRQGGQLGHSHVKISAKADQDLVQLAARPGVGPSHPEHRLRLIHSAIGGGGGGILGHPPPIEQPRRPIITAARIDLHRRGG